MPQTPHAQHFHAELTIPQSALQTLSELQVFSNSELKRLAQQGAVWVSRFDEQHLRHRKPERLRRLKTPLKIGDRLDLYYHPQANQPCDRTPHLIADYQDYSIWLKPRGTFSQGSKYGDACTLYRWAEVQTSRPCWIVHRLDRATHGLMLLAHNKKSVQVLTALFEQRQIEKRYQANVHGHLEQPLKINAPIDERHALSHILPQKRFMHNEAPCTRVEVRIETGRKHQIRKHLHSVGHPIIGDRLYGDHELDLRTFQALDLQLTASFLRFECPFSREIREFELAENQLDLLAPTAAPSLNSDSV
ncbi:RluA family pseudouridine synthase [Thiomicrorhabdus sp.]|uniref:RluA family pseudouridine synthase n=1 Tax=Thiomicrorhabdus sp. TaxID=2039724 RepID=UPI0029C73FCA|nr:RluA family pseudouridine synthase [Thiomicrorhabdus sp.]